MQAQKEIETVTVATRVTKRMLKAIKTILETNAYMNTADYVRDLIRRDLEKRGIQFEPIDRSTPP